MWGLARAQTYVSLHNIGSYTNASMIQNMYTSRNIDVYKAVLSVSTRKGTNICEFAKHRFIYNRIYVITYVCLWVSARIQRASKCQHSQGRKHMGFRTTWVQIQNCQWYNTCMYVWLCMYTNTCEYMCIKRGSKCEDSQRAQTYVSLHSTGSYTNVSMI